MVTKEKVRSDCSRENQGEGHLKSYNNTTMSLWGQVRGTVPGIGAGLRIRSHDFHCHAPEVSFFQLDPLRVTH